ncbi:MAG: hypothetical protein IJC10_05615 [Clostridia bacterium]|nr:hypothetical protein [Clostridia bacterium]
MSEKKYSLWDKIDNFWYYHKWKVAGVIFLIVAIIAVIGFNRANTDKRVYDFTAISVFARPMTTGDYTLDKQLEGVITDIDQNGDTALKMSNYYITEKANGSNDQMSMGQFESDLANARGDIILFDKANLERYLARDIFSDISDYTDLSQFPAEDIIYRNDIPVAVRLSDSKALSDMNFIIDDIYVSVMFTPDYADEKTLASRELAKDVIEKLIIK